MAQTVKEFLDERLDFSKFVKFEVKNAKDYNRLFDLVFAIKGLFMKNFKGPYSCGDIVRWLGYTDEEIKVIDKIGYESLNI